MSTVLDRELYHYTCKHGALHIERERFTLVPTWQPLLRTFASWATHLQRPQAAALGLTRHTLACDRTEYRFRVLEPDAFEWWPSWWRHRVDPRIASELGHPPARDALWYIALRATKVRPA